MALVISPNRVEKNGGYKITLTGLSLTDGDYYIHVGPLGTHEDPRAYAGAHGNGDVVTVATTSGSFVSPPLDSGGVYNITAYDISSPTVGGTVITSGIVSGFVYHNKNMQSETYSYRALQLDWFATGPRNIGEEEPQ